VFLLQTDPFQPKPALRALREADTLAAAGWDVAFVSWIKIPIAETTSRFPVTRVHVPVPAIGTSFPRRTQAYLRATRALAAAVVQERPDVIVSHDFEVLSAAIRAKRRTGAPVIYDSHEDWPALIAENDPREARIAAFQERRLCRQVDQIVTVSDPIAEKFRRWSRPTSVLYSARPFEEIQRASRDAARAGFGFAPSDFVVGFAGALGAGRGMEVLLEALGQLPDEFKGLIVGGPDREADDLRERCAKAGLARRLRVDGYRPFPELAPYYAAMDAGVILLDARANHLRAMPNKLFDYMAYGVPVVAPAYPAMSALLGQTKAGMTIAKVTSPDLQSALRTLQMDSDGRSVMASRGRDAFTATYSWDRQAEKFLTLVTAVVRRRHQ
jgi:glycosyltransferase involved in cell wall biosynthesis